MKKLILQFGGGLLLFAIAIGGTLLIEARQINNSWAKIHSGTEALTLAAGWEVTPQTHNTMTYLTAEFGAGCNGELAAAVQEASLKLGAETDLAGFAEAVDGTGDFAGILPGLRGWQYDRLDEQIGSLMDRLAPLERLNPDLPVTVMDWLVQDADPFLFAMIHSGTAENRTSCWA